MSSLDADKLKVFSGRANPALSQRVCDYLQIPLGRGKAELFADGELIVRIDEDVRGRDCYIVQPTSHPTNAHLMELFIWIDTLRRASAHRVTAVIPYFGYARQDRKDEGRTPITAKLVANLIERAGADRVVSIDLHAAQVQGFFDIPVDHLSASPVLIKWIKSLKLQNRVFVSPDVGNVKRASVYANILGGDLCIIDKRRKSGSDVQAVNIIGDVKDKNVIMVDDMITTAGTMTKAVEILKDHGALDIYIARRTRCAPRRPWSRSRLGGSPFTKLAVTDTIPIDERLDGIKAKVVTLSVADLLGEAIHRIHHNESVSALFRKDGGARDGKSRDEG
jgi:ribose-phosphate pyrophosphokinase